MYQTIKNLPLLKRLRNRLLYFSDNCGLRDVTYVITPRPIPVLKRLFWLITITACCIGSAIVLRGVLSLYTSNAISYSVETDYLKWETPFPAVTICENFDNNMDAVNKYLKEHNLPKTLAEFTKEVAYWNPKFCKSCENCKLGQTCVENFMDLVDGVLIKCADLLRDCWWDGKPFKCCERFRPIQTEYGTCYVFNSRLTGNDSIMTINRKTGLPKLVFSATDNIMVKIHSPDDIVSAAMENILKTKCYKLPPISEFLVELRAEQTVSDISVQLLSPASRDCLFRHELPAHGHLWPFAQYSYSSCILYTRALIQTDICNCTHHFMPQLGGFPKCDINGLVCITKQFQKVAENINAEKYHCPMSCEDIVYKVTRQDCERYKSNDLTKELMLRGTRGQLHIGTLPTLRVRRHAIRELLGLVVDFGGVIGVFFGASLLSFIEIIYLLFFRKYP